MSIKKKALVFCTAAAMLLPMTSTLANAQAPAAHSKDKIKDQKQLSKQELKDLKNSVKFSKSKEYPKITQADFKSDDVEVTVILDEGQDLTDEMLQNSTDYVSTAKTETVLPDPGSIGTYVEENPGAGALIGTRKINFTTQNVTYIRSAIVTGFTGIVGLVAARFGPAGAQATSAIGSGAGVWINAYLRPAYTTTKMYRTWSNTYNHYMYDEYENIYDDSGRTNIRKVYVKYNLPQVGSIVGP